MPNHEEDEHAEMGGGPQEGEGPQDGGEVEGFSFGGRKRRRRRKSRKKSKKQRKSKSARKSRKTKKKRRRKRKLNQYFKLMLAAKKKGLTSFKYKGSTYVGRKHKRLGMIYKKK